MAYPVRRLPFEGLTSIDELVVHDQIATVLPSLNKLLEKEVLPLWSQEMLT